MLHWASAPTIRRHRQAAKIRQPARQYQLTTVQCFKESLAQPRGPDLRYAGAKPRYRQIRHVAWRLRLVPI